MRWALAALFVLSAGTALAAEPRQIGVPTTETPHAIPGGFDLPSGWRITPASTPIAQTGDWVLKLTVAPDGRAIIALNAGYQPHGLTVIDPKTHAVVQRITLRSAWLGMSWAPDGKTLFVSGGNATGDKPPPGKSPIYAFAYADGKLSDQPIARFDETLAPFLVWWSGVARHPTRPVLYAANRGIAADPTYVAAFDAASGALLPWSHGFSVAPDVFLASGSAIFAGGSATGTLDGEPAGGLTTLDQSW